MDVSSDSPYLPKSRVKNYISILKTNVAYRVWKRKFKKYGSFKKKNSFRIIEVGCGPGYFLRCAEKWFPAAEIYGLDIDSSLISFASRQVQRTRLIHHDGHELPFESNTFDIVCSFQVIEHLKEPAAFFGEAKRILTDKGLLLISTPNPAGIPAKVLKGRWQGNRFDHISLKTPKEWKRIMLSCGFQILDDGTTLLTGFKLLQKIPLALINWIPMALFGYFRWYKGESYMAVARKI